MAVTVEQVATTMRRPITDPQDIAAVEMWIGDAEAQVRLRYPDPTRQPDPGLVDIAVREAVAARAASAGDGVKAVQVAVDDGSIRREYQSAASAVDWLDAWWAKLDASLPDATGDGAWSIYLAGGGRAW